jgi:hypothetical protein
MDLALEGILETVLVGAIASLCVLTALFLFVPSFTRIQTIWHLFRFLLYEDQPPKPLLPASGDDPLRYRPSSTAPPPPDEHAYGGKAHALFLGLLMSAGLYGSGIIAESLSNHFTGSVGSGMLARELWFFSDPGIRIKAFEDVGTGALASGNTPAEFSEFMVDYSACREAHLLENERFSPTCNTIYKRARSFYYEAKNIIYQEHTYFEELSRLQRRIDFTRAVSQSLALLALLLVAGFFYGMVAEAIYLQLRGRQGWVGRLRGMLVRRPAIDKWLDHGTLLAARRLLYMGLLILFFGVVAAASWHHNEEDYDKRVFGYFLASQLGQPERAESAAAREEESAPAQGAKPAPAKAKAEGARRSAARALPESTYRPFGPGAESADRFEPSAIEALGSGNVVLVANDKGGPTQLSVFEFDETTGLQYRSSVELPVTRAGGTDASVKLEKIESLDARRTDKGYHVFAATSFERSAGKVGIAEFNLSEDFQATDGHELAGVDPCAKVNAKGCVIEGLASRQPDEFFLGVRALGTGEHRTPTLALLQYKRVGDKWEGTQLWSAQTLVVETKDEAKPSRQTLAQIMRGNYKQKKHDPFAKSGISALEFEFEDKDNNEKPQSLLILTSVEEEDQPGTADQVRGALWRIPAKHLERPDQPNWRVDLDKPKKYPQTYLVNVFVHKPEGVTVLGNDSMLVVFDDDGRRKSRSYAPATFALDQNQGVFSVIRPLPPLPDEKQ